MSFRVLFSLFSLIGGIRNNSISCSSFALPQQRRRATASTTWRSMSTSSETQGVGDEISEYLSRNVDAVALPEIWDEDSTYAPLILDAASGTGKTQQAFALVKEHKSIIYFLMSEPSKGDLVKKEQKIYQSMRDLTMDLDIIRFAHLVEVAIKALGEDEDNKDKDICSVKVLRDKIKGAGNKPIHFIDEDLWVRAAPSGVKGRDQLMDVVLWMCSKHLQLNEGSRLNVVPIKPDPDTEGKTSCKFEDLCSQLKDIILFLDEALPTGAGDLPDSGALDRLRFVRNLGRALTMKVVLAGTAATAANMIADVRNAESRNQGSGELAWIDCQLLWKPMLEEEVKKVFPNLASSDPWGRALISELGRGRPYLVHLISRVMTKLFQGHINRSNLLAVLEEVGKELQSAKSMSDVSKVVILLGVWLYHQGRTSPSAYLVTPAELVRGSYFEPAVVVDENGKPVCGLLWGKRSVKSGHLRVKISCDRPGEGDKIMCCASIQGEEARADFCWDFSGIEYSLSACVQQCLAREPLLAVALSTQCKMDTDKFRETLPKVYTEQFQQLNVDEVDGKQNEQILFALLQLASNSQGITGPKVELVPFLRKIVDFLTNESDYKAYESFAKCVGEFSRKLKLPGFSEGNLQAMSSESNKGFAINDRRTGKVKECIMSWLVPACSLEALNETMGRASSLFDGLGIAGLVPGDREAAFDAEAYPWKTLEKVAYPEWVFEFKARAGSYSIADAFRDLKGKCVRRHKELQPVIDQPDQTEVDEPETTTTKKKKTRRTRGPDNLSCHAILIAVAGSQDTRCEIRTSGNYLRVALVVGLGRKLLK